MGWLDSLGINTDTIKKAYEQSAFARDVAKAKALANEYADVIVDGAGQAGDLVADAGNAAIAGAQGLAQDSVDAVRRLQAFKDANYAARRNGATGVVWDGKEINDELIDAAKTGSKVVGAGMVLIPGGRQVRNAIKHGLASRSAKTVPETLPADARSLDAVQKMVISDKRLPIKSENIEYNPLIRDNRNGAAEIFEANMNAQRGLAKEIANDPGWIDPARENAFKEEVYRRIVQDQMKRAN